MFKCNYLSAGALVMVTGGPFDVSDINSNNYNLSPTLVVLFDYRLHENLTSRSSEDQGFRGTWSLVKHLQPPK